MEWYVEFIVLSRLAYFIQKEKSMSMNTNKSHEKGTPVASKTKNKEKTPAKSLNSKASPNTLRKTTKRFLRPINII